MSHERRRHGIISILLAREMVPFYPFTVTDFPADIRHDIRVVKRVCPILAEEQTTATNGSARVICLHYSDVSPMWLARAR